MQLTIPPGAAAAVEAGVGCGAGGSAAAAELCTAGMMGPPARTDTVAVGRCAGW